MDIDYMLILATAAFAFGLSLATYRWFALHNGWPMGEWQAHRPGLPIAIGLFAMLFAMLFALARGGAATLLVPLIGLLGALTWTAITRVGAQSALFFAPAAMIALLAMWYMAASQVEPGVRSFIDDSARPNLSAAPTSEVRSGTIDRAATDREAFRPPVVTERDPSRPTSAVTSPSSSSPPPATR